MALYIGDELIAGSFKSGANWEVGDVGISALGIDEALNKRRYLNGQVISQAQFVQFTAFLKSRVSVYPSLATTEVNWQAEVTNSDLGQCGKFVIDDDAGTIRLPKVVNINGLQDLTGLGGIKAESLPNIKGSLIVDGDSDVHDTIPSTVPSGAFKVTSGQQAWINGGNYGTISINGGTFDASRSSSTYQDDAPVQQEAVQYPYFIQVATGVETSVDVSREIELNNPFSLLDYKYSEYKLSNASWLLSNGQWNSGAVYQSVYNLLLQIYNGTVTKAGVSVKLSTETYADTDFVLNTSDTTFRLPIKVLMAGSKRVAGNGMTLGLTDGTNNFGIGTTNTTSGTPWRNVLYGANVGISVSGSALTSSLGAGITTDETKSGIETSANGLYLYFYVGETVQDANIIAAGQALTDIADLKNASNFSSLGKEIVVGWGMPDYSAGVAITAPYTVTQYGFIRATSAKNIAQAEITVNGENFDIATTGPNTYMRFDSSIFVSPNDTITTGSNVTALTFFPLKGVAANA